MSSVTGTYSITVNPGTTQNPLTITPASATLVNETEGVADSGQLVATVNGGTRPYNYNVTGIPPGMSMTAVASADGKGGDDLMLSGAPNVGDAASSPFTITVDVSDSSAPAQTARAQTRRHR